MNVNVSADKFVPPVLDFSIFQKWGNLSQDEKIDFVKNTFEPAFKQSGEFLIINSGIPSDVEKNARESLERFFVLPSVHKSSLACKHIEIGYAEPKHGQHRADASKETFQTGADISDEFFQKAICEAEKADPEKAKLLTSVFESMRADRNRWPDELDGIEQMMYRGYGCDPRKFRKNIEALVNARLDVAQNAMRALALMLGEEEEYFIDRSQIADHRMRFLNYLPNATSADDAMDHFLWAEPHTDKGVLTLLLPASGLVFERKIGQELEEIDMNKAEGDVLMQLGICTEVLTNCQATATRHAVVEDIANRKGEPKARYQAPFFAQIDPTTILTPSQKYIDENDGINYFPLPMLHREFIQLSSKVYRAVQIMTFTQEHQDNPQKLGEDVKDKRDVFNFILDAQRTRVSELIDGINLKKEDPKYGGLLKQLETFLVEEDIITNEDDQTLTLTDKAYDI